ncbi:MAG: DUF2007 domain-containing protein [Pedobacter sp.]|nr:MAG: DUF2007 domain-containing protein [Pedobacter sp.]
MDNDIIVYKTFYNPVEANIVSLRLKDAGFPNFLTDEYVSTIQPFYNQAIGGVKLNIFKKDEEAIAQLLDEEVRVPDDEALESEHIICTECGSNNVSYGQATGKRFSWWVALLSLLLFVYPFKANKCFHCYDCGNEFK